MSTQLCPSFFNSPLKKFSQVTERPKHATEIARALSLEFDAIVICSGDGLLHEIYNGFAEHSDPIRAFSIPIAPVPTGSANGTCLNLLGAEVSYDFIRCLFIRIHLIFLGWIRSWLSYFKRYQGYSTLPQVREYKTHMFQANR